MHTKDSENSADKIDFKTKSIKTRTPYILSMGSIVQHDSASNFI